MNRDADSYLEEEFAARINVVEVQQLAVDSAGVLQGAGHQNANAAQRGTTLQAALLSVLGQEVLWESWWCGTYVK